MEKTYRLADAKVFTTFIGAACMAAREQLEFAPDTSNLPEISVTVKCIKEEFFDCLDAIHDHVVEVYALGQRRLEDEEEREPDDEDDAYVGDGTFFAEPGGRSALRASSLRNPRNLPCPTCGEPDRLTPADRRRGYQCDRCADSVEMGGCRDYGED